MTGPIPNAFEGLFENSPEAIWVVDRNTLNFLECNFLATERYGFSRHEFLRMNLADLHMPENIRRLNLLLAEGKYSGPELSNWKSRTRSGDLLDVDQLIRPVHFRGIDALIVVPVDVRERKAVEAQLMHAQKMEAVGMLAGGIAHDFNNLLTIISGYSQMMLAGMAQAHPERNGVEQILKASERAADLTRQLLAFSRRQVAQPKVLNLNAILDGMSTMLRRLIGEHIDLKIDSGLDIGSVRADTGQLDQLVMNLVVNARDAMSRGGMLLIETRNVELDESYAREHLTVRAGRYVMLSVTDTGIGMDEKTRMQVFDPFFTTKGEGHGTGLGMSTVYGIIKQGGGAVDIYSELGKGTVVKIYFPRVDEAAQAEDDLEVKPTGGRETILVVEDEEAVRKLVRATLERHGYHVLVAPSGAQALLRTKEHPGKIDLLITDMVMPEMSGRDVSRRIRRLRKDIAVLYMSGYTDLSLQHTGKLSRGMQFLQKPFTPTVLVRKVREMLDVREAKKEKSA